MNKIGLNEFQLIGQEFRCSCFVRGSKNHQHLTYEETEYISYVLSMDFIVIEQAKELRGFDTNE